MDGKMAFIIIARLVGVVAGIIGGITQEQFTFWSFSSAIWALGNLLLATIIRRRE